MKQTKKEQLITNAKILFDKYGFKKVTIDEICKKANVSRKTFYTYFENKNDLVLIIFHEMMDNAFSIYEGIVESELHFAEKLEKIFSYKYLHAEKISMEFISDFYNPESAELLEFFNKNVEKSLLFMRDFFKKAQENGEMNPDISLDYVMWLMQKATESCGTKELMSLFPDAETLTRQVSQSLVYGIMPINRN